MTTPLSFSVRHNNPCSSSTFLNTHSSPFNINHTHNLHKPYTDCSSSDKPWLQNRANLSQSTFFTPLNDNHPKPSGFSKLQNMARNLPTQQLQNLQPLTIQNSLQPTTSSQIKPKRTFNPFASQISITKTSNNIDMNFDGKRLSAEPNNHSRRRRESIQLNNNYNGRGLLTSNMKFLQRTLQILPQKQNIENKNKEQNKDKQIITNTIKPKHYDFLKKRKDNDHLQQNKGESSQSATQLQSFNHFRRPEQIWTPSIPLQHKIIEAKIANHLTESTSAKRLENTPKTMEHPNSPFSAIEFKRKKLTDSQASCKSSEPSKDTNIPKEQPVHKSRFLRFQREITIDDFQIMDKLGKGAFGQVFKAFEKQLGFLCVIKKMSKKRIRQAKVQQHIIREIKLQSYLSHSHLTALYGYFHDTDNIYLILELLPDGSLQQVKKKRKLPQKEAIEIVRQVAVGLKYMHEESVIHRDLKPENLFVNQGYVKLGDFGCSIYNDDEGLRKTIVGCLEYSSPEQLCRQGYSDKIDAWSLGILTYEILFGKSPFESDIKKIVMSGESRPELSEVSFPATPVLSEEGRQFIVKMLSVIPENRMDMDEALAHPFLRQKDEK